MTPAQEEAELLKAEGNRLFAKEKIGAAIDKYTEAITLCPKVAVYYTNRALCFRRKSDWKRMEEDCKKALELDRESVKGHYMLGLAHLEHKFFPEAIRSLEKAMELARGGKGGSSSLVEEIWLELAKAKYDQWLLDSAERKERQVHLRKEVARLLKLDYEYQKSQLQGMLSRPPGGSPETVSSAERVAPDASTETSGSPSMDTDTGSIAGKSPSSEIPVSSAGKYTDADSRQADQDDDLAGAATGDNGRSEGRDANNKTVSWQAQALTHLEEEYMENVNTMENVFEKAAVPDRPSEIPDHLCCSITMDLFRDPVVTPSGISYERSVLIDHLKRGHNFDPVTRKPLEPGQVAPNLALREAVQAYLDEHGWAYQTRHD